MARRNPAVNFSDFSERELELIKFIESLKSSLLHHRLYGNIGGSVLEANKKLSFTEGDIEEFLIDNGYWISDYDY